MKAHPEEFVSDANDLGPDLAAGVAVTDIPDGGMKAGHIRGTKALLARYGHEVFAIGAACSHLGGPLDQGLLVDHAVRCPWHHACFSLRSGRPLAAPAFDPLPRWEVVVEHGCVRVGNQTPAPTPTRLRRSTGSDDRFVVIGGGAAGFAAVNMLLCSDFAGQITMISDDTAPPYDRTLLTKDYLDGHFGDDHLPLSNRNLFSEDRVQVMLRTTVKGIDPTARRLTLDDGRVLSYSKLLLATGAAPKLPNFPGAELPHVKLLRSLEDCRNILTAARVARDIVVVGGGFIGLEAAASLRDRGCKVSVVAPEKQPMARIFGSQLAELIAAVHRDHGVDWHVGRKIEQVTEATVRLDDGTVLDADLVVVGIGVAPRIGLAQAAGIAVDDGVLVDEYLATSAPDIFAAGDIARWLDRYSGGRIRVEHWVVAERQGQLAALNMMGHRQSYVAVPFFWTKHFDLSIRYIGHATSWDELNVEGDLSRRDGLVRFVKGGRLLAVATVERDVVALEEELAWESAGAPRNAA
jgi:NADPH-dependent 2,4-dienoyl-CoA reductase/sulfur reductase-like enzyme/nitrite reductase/ring-hydroxylating ferredoxin subunit